MHLGGNCRSSGAVRICEYLCFWVDGGYGASCRGLWRTSGRFCRFEDVKDCNILQVYVHCLQYSWTLVMCFSWLSTCLCWKQNANKEWIMNEDFEYEDIIAHHGHPACSITEVRKLQTGGWICDFSYWAARIHEPWGKLQTPRIEELTGLGVATDSNRLLKGWGSNWRPLVFPSFSCESSWFPELPSSDLEPRLKNSVAFWVRTAGLKSVCCFQERTFLTRYT